MVIKDLKLLKKRRLSEQSRMAQQKPSLSQRLINLYQHHSRLHMTIIAICLTLKDLVIKVLLKLNQELDRLKNRPVPVTFVLQKDTPIYYAIRIYGGLGDAVIIARLVRDLQNDLGDVARFDIYAGVPSIVASFYEHIPGLVNVMRDPEFPVSHLYTFVLKVNQYIQILSTNIDDNMLKVYPKIGQYLDHIHKINENILPYINTEPRLEGLFADKLVPEGKKRFSYLHEMIGIPYGGERLSLAVNSDICHQYGLIQGQYVTVHDGWDQNMCMDTSRATKALPLEKWIEIVRLFKEKNPDLKVVQLGAKAGAVIPGVDLCLKEKLSFIESTSILACAKLHIDAESGLVHLAAALGVPSVVMFGPTNVDWFGYPQNINIAPTQCGNCWWVTDTWMSQCPIGYEKPICTQSIDPKDVVNKATLSLKKNA